MPNQDMSWGSDVPVSMPVTIDDSEILIDMGTHAFTPGGMKLNATESVRQEIISHAYLPVDGGD